jgi:cardiolipin synthase
MASAQPGISPAASLPDATRTLTSPVRALKPNNQVKKHHRHAAPTPSGTPLLHRGDASIFTHPTRQNGVTLHITSAESKVALLTAVQCARQSFFIETFEWHDDHAGNELIQALAARKRAAAAVGEHFDAKVLIDWEGMQSRPGDEAVVAKLKAAGVEVLVYHEGYFNGPNIAPLTHRKLYIQDGDRFMTGGRNIGDEYLNKTFKDATGQRQNGWHDLLVTIEGEETSRAIKAFYDDWVVAGGASPTRIPVVNASPTGTAKVQTFVTDPDRQIYGIRTAHAAMIASARHEIDLQVPYLSDSTLIAQLLAAKRARPKLNIRVMLPAQHENTTSGQAYALLNEDSARQLVAGGIEVRMFGGGHENGHAVARFSHLKAMVVDGQVLSVGSANGDARTYGLNHELISVIEDPTSVNHFMDSVIRPDWRDAKPFDPTASAANQSPFAALTTSLLKGIGSLL